MQAPLRPPEFEPQRDSARPAPVYQVRKATLDASHLEGPRVNPLEKNALGVEEILFLRRGRGPTRRQHTRAEGTIPVTGLSRTNRRSFRSDRPRHHRLGGLIGNRTPPGVSTSPQGKGPHQCHRQCQKGFHCHHPYPIQPPSITSLSGYWGQSSRDLLTNLSDVLRSDGTWKLKPQLPDLLPLSRRSSKQLSLPPSSASPREPLSFLRQEKLATPRGLEPRLLP